MKITILDGYSLNPGDLTWEPFEKLGEVTVYDRTKPEDTLARMQGSEIIITNKTVIKREHIQACSSLKYIGLLSTGYNVVDLEAAAEKHIPVCNVPGYSSNAVAQMTFALILELMNHTALHSDSVHAGDWSRCSDFCYWKEPIVDLAGKTMGLIGFGSIGQKTAAIAIAFGMEVLVYNRTKKTWLENEHLRFASLEEVLEKSDIISLHCPLFAETKNIINKSTIAKMKDGAYLINTARGACVDEEALAEALNTGKLAGAGADVVSVEPMEASNPLLGAKNMILTPHISWASTESRKRLMQIAADNLAAFQKGNPQNNVCTYAK